jgi:hypothetical protein
MNYFIIFLLLLLIFVSNAYIIGENFDTIAEIQQKQAIQEAKAAGFDSGFYDTSAPETEDQKIAREATEAELAEKADYTKAINDYDVEYHDSAEKIAKEQQGTFGINTVFVFDPKSNKMIAINTPAMQNSPTYYYPGEYTHGAASYVPDYTDSVLLSKKNNLLNKNASSNTSSFVYYDINSALSTDTNLVSFDNA